jgi:hypothetical protein
MARTRCQMQVSSCAAAASSAPSARLGASRFSLLSSGTGLLMKSSGFTPRRPMLAPSSGAAGGAGGAGAAGAARGSARGAGACHSMGGEGRGAPPLPGGQSSAGYLGYTTPLQRRLVLLRRPERVRSAAPAAPRCLCSLQQRLRQRA